MHVHMEGNVASRKHSDPILHDMLLDRARLNPFALWRTK